MKKIALLLITLLLLQLNIYAQGCVVCTQTAAGLGESSARGLNTGIIYLAAIPLIFIFTVGFIWYKKNKASSE